MHKDILNKRYQDLCQELGHHINNLDKLQEKIKSLKEEISAINEAVAVLNIAELKSAKKETKSETNS